MKKILLFVLIIVPTIIFAQGEASNWYFGNSAGIRFDPVTFATTPLNDASPQFQTSEGCATISDVNGNLLLYVGSRSNQNNQQGNILTIWNRNHQIMPNGTDILGSSTSTQAAIVIPQPENPNRYYVFTVDGLFPGENNPADLSGFNYSVVDMSLDGGLGDVVPAEKNLPILPRSSEKVTAVRGDGNFFWVLTHYIDTFYAYRVDSTGFSLASEVTSQVGPVLSEAGYRSNSQGYLKVSPDGTKIAMANYSDDDDTSNGPGNIFIFSFDPATGQVGSGGAVEEIYTGDSPYGVEFSAESRKLYATILLSGSQSTLLQYNVENPIGSIAATQTLINGPNSNSPGALQLAIDGRIYRVINGSNSLHYIENPELDGAAAGYNTAGVPIGGSAVFGLPPFITSFFSASINFQGTCLGSPTDFSVNTSSTIDNILWDFGDGTTSTLETPSHSYTAAGTYTVTAQITSGVNTQNFTTDITISETPTANPVDDQLICDDNNDGFWALDLDALTTNVLNGQKQNV